MFRNRYLWTLGISLLCLAGILMWANPTTVWTALSNPQYSSSPRVTVQRFWNFVDSRQVNLAHELILEKEISANAQKELDKIENSVEKYPLLSLQKIEFLEAQDPQAILVCVYWNSPPSKTLTAEYYFDVKQINEGWYIKDIRRVKELSFVGGNRYGGLFRT